MEIQENMTVITTIDIYYAVIPKHQKYCLYACYQLPGKGVDMRFMGAYLSKDVAFQALLRMEEGGEQSCLV